MSAGNDKESEKTAKPNCAGDGKTWTDAADKAQDELEESGKVEESEAEEMKKHASA